MHSNDMHVSGVRVAAPAKINLFLEIRQRRDDGFHELETVMIGISLFDAIRLSPSAEPRLSLHYRSSLCTSTLDAMLPRGLHEYALNEVARPARGESNDHGSWHASRGASRSETAEGGTFEGRQGRHDFDHAAFPIATAEAFGCSSACGEDAGAASESLCQEQVPLGEENLAWRAVELVRVEAGIDTGACIELFKRIPTQAGLGGGSSDAAAALIAACRLWQLDWSLERLNKMAAKLGSDVAFFLHGPAAICRGRGEKVQPLQLAGSLGVVVAMPPAGLATRDVFARVEVPQQARSASKMVEAMRDGNLRAIGPQLFNRLETAAREICPWIERVMNSWPRLLPLGFAMTGSGTASYALFPTWSQTLRAASIMRARLPGVQVYACRTLGRTR